MAVTETILNQIRTGQAVGTPPPPVSTGPVTTTVTYAPQPVSTIPQTIREMGSLRNVYYPLEIPKYYMRLEISDYSRASLLRLGTLQMIGNIILPLPQNLIDAHNVSYEEKDLGIFQGPTAAAINSAFGGTAVIGRPDTPINNQLSGQQQLTRRAQIAGIIGGAASQAIGVTPPGFNPLRAFTGMAPNRFLTILLQGPKYKTFDFTWRLSPKTEQESEALRIIRRDLNNYMSPGLAGLGLIFTFPKIFQISLMPNSKYMYKFKPAVLRNLTINYTPGQQPAFYKARPGTDNLPAPEGIDMTMSFIELEYWLDGDFNNSNVATENGLREATNITPPLPTSPPPTAPINPSVPEITPPPPQT